MRRAIADAILRGWAVDPGELASPGSCAVIGRAQMSRRETALVLVAAWSAGRNARWLYPVSAYSTVFALAGLVGGLGTSGSVDNAVEQVRQQAAGDPHFALIATPAFMADPSWYDVIYAAALPLIVAAIDVEARTIRFGPMIELTGDRGGDLAQI